MLGQLQHRPVVRQHIADHFHGAPGTAIINHLLHKGHAQAFAFHPVIYHDGELATQIVGIGPGTHRTQGLLAFTIFTGRIGDEHHFPVIVDLHHLGHVFPGKMLAVLEESVTDGFRRLMLVKQPVGRLILRQHRANNHAATGFGQYQPLLQLSRVGLDNGLDRMFIQVNGDVYSNGALLIE